MHHWSYWRLSPYHVRCRLCRHPQASSSKHLLWTVYVEKNSILQNNCWSPWLDTRTHLDFSRGLIYLKKYQEESTNVSIVSVSRLAQHPGLDAKSQDRHNHKHNYTHNFQLDPMEKNYFWRKSVLLEQLHLLSKLRSSISILCLQGNNWTALVNTCRNYWNSVRIIGKFHTQYLILACICQILFNTAWKLFMLGSPLEKFHGYFSPVKWFPFSCSIQYTAIVKKRSQIPIYYCKTKTEKSTQFSSTIKIRSQ